LWTGNFHNNIEHLNKREVFLFNSCGFVVILKAFSELLETFLKAFSELLETFPKAF
jgi:hypothetical protein